MSKRTKAVLDLLNCFFLLIWSIVMIPVGWKFFMKSYAINEVDEMVLAHPIWWVKFLIVVGMILISLQGVSEVVKIVMGMRGRTPNAAGGEGGKA
jgi:TRAP-type mannitol/chloroaromatic compound transport system permease small subunit